MFGVGLPTAPSDLTARPPSSANQGDLRSIIVRGQETLAQRRFGMFESYLQTPFCAFLAVASEV